MQNTNELLIQAVKETELLFAGEKFLVRDLFKGYEWNRVSRSDRLLLGTLFLNYVNQNKSKVKPIGKSTSGQQQYMIMEEKQ